MADDSGGAANLSKTVAEVVFTDSGSPVLRVSTYGIGPIAFFRCASVHKGQKRREIVSVAQRIAHCANLLTGVPDYFVDPASVKPAAICLALSVLNEQWAAVAMLVDEVLDLVAKNKDPATAKVPVYFLWDISTVDEDHPTVVGTYLTREAAEADRFRLASEFYRLHDTVDMSTYVIEEREIGDSSEYYKRMTELQRYQEEIDLDTQDSPTQDALPEQRCQRCGHTLRVAAFGGFCDGCLAALGGPQ